MMVMHLCQTTGALYECSESMKQLDDTLTHSLNLYAQCKSGLHDHASSLDPFKKIAASAGSERRQRILVPPFHWMRSFPADRDGLA